jgi:hypothetical protein
VYPWGTTFRTPGVGFADGGWVLLGSTVVSGRAFLVCVLLREHSYWAFALTGNVK